MNKKLYAPNLLSGGYLVFEDELDFMEWALDENPDYPFPLPWDEFCVKYPDYVEMPPKTEPITQKDEPCPF